MKAQAASNTDTGNVHNDLIGVLLCGGQSRRMGSDKALLAPESEYMIQRNYKVLKDLQIPVMVSIRADQHQDYAKLLENAKFINDSFDCGGPLQGILSVHKMFPTKDLLVMAVDQYFENDMPLRKLLCLDTNEIRVFEIDEQIQPIPGFYPATLLNLVLEKVQDDLLQNSSLVRLIGNLPSKKITLNREEAWQSFNTPEEYQKLNTR